MNDRDQAARIDRALKAAITAATLIDQAYAHEFDTDQATRLRIASQDSSNVVAMLRSADSHSSHRGA